MLVELNRFAMVIGLNLSSKTVLEYLDTLLDLHLVSVAKPYLFKNSVFQFGDHSGISSTGLGREILSLC